jgi:hypothetical protein
MDQHLLAAALLNNGSRNLKNRLIIKEAEDLCLVDVMFVCDDERSI